MSGATSQRESRGASADVCASVAAGTVTASPAPWHSRGGMPSVRPKSSQRSREGRRWAVPGAANISSRPRWAATGPEPGPSFHSRSSMRRPKTAGALTTSKTEPHGRTTGACGRSRQRASVLRGYVPAEASQAAPSRVTPVTSQRSSWKSASRVLLMPSTSTDGEQSVSLGCRKAGQGRA
ncbi:hypothetical protein ADL34_04285 [Streptomyces sp. NRRL WC-3605]|nr:hypothetical protein ADL34_04285 [Streptomyces sp. NRRL WC-3605]KUL79602.1 hypothetical protein ADL33_03730 [Streptomyces sp. NRRL WC-3604]